jgi:phosphohistidine phosphatase
MIVRCSTAKRARETWALAAAALDPPPTVRYEERLYDATADELLAVRS